MAGQQESVETIRIPWYATDEQRIVHASASVPTNTGADQLLVNCFPVLHKNPMAPDAGTQKVYSRAGLSQVETTVDISSVVAEPDRCVALDMLAMGQLADVIVIAYLDRSNDKIYIVQYRTFDNTCLKIGEISGYSVSYTVSLSELSVSNVPGVGVTVYPLSNSGGALSAGYFALTTSGLFTASSLTEIVDTDFPPKQTPARQITGNFVQMDGYTFILTVDGAIYNSDLNSITSWNTSGYTNAASRPDLGRTLVRYKHHIVAFGESSIEFFNNAGIAPPASPLERTNQAFINFGTNSAKGVINVDDTLYWFAASANNTIGLWKLEGYTPMLLSDQYYSYKTNTVPEYCNLQSFMMHGMRHIMTNVWGYNNMGWLEDSTEASPITPDNENLWGTWVYCVDTKAWWWWAFEFGLSDNVTNNNGYTPQAILWAHQRQHTWSSRTYAILVCAFLNGTTINNYGAHPMYLSQGIEGSGYNTAFDAVRDGNATTLFYWRIPVQIVTNVYDFGTNNRKSIPRAKVIANDFITSFVNSSEPWISFEIEGLTYRFGWTHYNTAILYHNTSAVAPNATPDLWHTRHKILPVEVVAAAADQTAVDPQTASRFYFNNLGQAREWRFVFNMSTFTPLRLDSLELTIRKDTH